MSINIQLEGGLKKLSGQTMSKDKIIEKLGYTPANEATVGASIAELNSDLETLDGALEDHKNSMSGIDAGSADDEFVIADPSGNVIAKFDDEGLHTASIEAESFTSNDKELAVYDDNGNVAFKVDENGITHAAKLKLNSGDVDEQLVKLTADTAEHASNGEIHVTVQNKADWNAKSDFSGEFGDLKNSPITEDNSGELVYADEAGNIIFKVAQDGAHTTELTLIGGKVDERLGKLAADLAAHKTEVNNSDSADPIHLQSGERAAWNSKSDVKSYYDLPDAPNIITDSDDESLLIADEDGNVIAKVDTNGLETTKVTANRLLINNKNLELAFDSDSNVKESYLTWGGRNLAGTVSPIDAAALDVLSANRFAFANPVGITVEYSTDGGSNYSVYTAATTSDKVNLVSGIGTNLLIGGTRTSTTTGHKLRITLKASDMGVYTMLRKLLIKISTNYATGSNVIVEKAMVGSDTDFSAVGTYQLAGWPAWNSIPMEGRFGTSDNSNTSRIATLRLTFGITGVDSTHPNNSALEVVGIACLGETSWQDPSNMSRTGHIYSYDTNQNATFPADINLSIDGNNTSVKEALKTTTAHASSSHAPAAAQENVIETIKVNNAAVTVSSKAVNITVPTKNSDLTNDSGYLVASDIANKVDKVTGKGLSTNDFTNDYKSKVDNAVQTTRKVNNKALSSDITLTASDVGALPSTTVIPSISGLAAETYVNSSINNLRTELSESTVSESDELIVADNDGNIVARVDNAGLATTTLEAKEIKIDGKSIGDIFTADSAVKESYLAWGGKNLVGTVSPVDAAALDAFSANRFAFSSPNGIVIEYSTDGSTFSDYGASNAEKINLVSGINTNCYIGKRSSGTTVNDKLRITLNASQMSVYTTLRKLLININTNYSTGSNVKVETKTYSATDFSEVGTYLLSGWSGWNSIPMSGRFGSRSSHVTDIRLTFGITGVNSEQSANALTVLNIACLGETCWTSPSDMARYGHIYSYDADQNTIFPAGIKINGKDGIDIETALNSKASNTHTHGSITNAGAIGTTADKFVITGTNGVLTTTDSPMSKLGITATAAELNCVKGIQGPIQTKLDSKADKATTISGYGITDAYTKTEVDNALDGKASLNSSNTFTGTNTFTNKVSFKNDVESVNLLPYETFEFLKLMLPEELDGLLVIPRGVTVINKDEYSSEINNGVPFYDGVVIPNTVNTIGESAFHSQSVLGVLIFPGIQTIGNEAFYGCTNLSSVNLPDTITNIGEYAFANCASLASIVIPQNITEIKSATFLGCAGLETISIPNSVTSICEAAFSGCEYLQTINIPSNLTTVGVGAFYGCSRLVTFPVSENTTSIGANAFNGCAFTSAEIPSGIKKIEDKTFYDCKNLTIVSIPNSVTNIGQKAFCNCTKLTNINYDGAKTKWNSITKSADWKTGSNITIVHCTDGDLSL